MNAGASDAIALSLANATLAAECCGRSAVGFAHLPDYLEGFEAGRISCTAQPRIDFPTPASVRVDAGGGIAQLGFDVAFRQLVKRTRVYGIAMFVQANGYTAGELGYYTRRLAESGLVSFAVSNGPALMAAGRAQEPVYGTNPFSLAAPVEGDVPLVIDQATSATAFVNLRKAAQSGARIPEGWVVDARGHPVTDAREAMNGLLLAFGGGRGANIALMVEVLAAGMSGANWSLDAPSFSEGSDAPGVGLFIAAMAPDVLVPGFRARLAAQLNRLSEKGVHIPGRSPAIQEVDIPDPVAARIARWSQIR
jgi:(2R)-3-sulfolactate dehydrogenase (NADP+)